MNDSELADRIQGGDRSAWPDLRRSCRGVVEMLVGLWPNPSSYESRADICCDIWVDVCVAMNRRLYDSSKQRFGTWLWSVASNHLYQRTRRKRFDEVPLVAACAVTCDSVPVDILIDMKRAVESGNVTKHVRSVWSDKQRAKMGETMRRAWEKRRAA